MINAVTASCIFAYAFHRMGRVPSALDLAASALLFAVACVLLYSLWILTVSAAFYVVRIDNLTYLFTAVFDAARWPSTVFRGALRVFFTLVLPLAIMTTFPAEALLGRIAPLSVVEALVAAAVFATLSRVVWLRSVRRYTSASS
jgi:ABC-2 type transport system permease protein